MTNTAVFRHHVPLHTIYSIKDFSQTEQNQLMSTPQEQNVDCERGRMLRIYIGFQAIKILLFSPHHHHHHISIVFPPPPPPHFYCFLSTTTTASTFLLFSLHHHFSNVFLLHHHHHISIVFPPPPPPPPPPPHFHWFPSTRFHKRLPTAILSSFCSNVSCSEQQSWFSSTVS